MPETPPDRSWLQTDEIRTQPPNADVGRGCVIVVLDLTWSLLLLLGIWTESWQWAATGAVAAVFASRATVQAWIRAWREPVPSPISRAVDLDPWRAP